MTFPLTEHREKERARYKARRESALLQKKSYYKNHRERLIAYQKQWNKNNQDKKKQTDRSSRRANPESDRVRVRNRASRKRNAEGWHTADEIKSLLKKQNSRCANPVCGVSIKTKYHADHITPLARGGSNWISNIQLLCPPCNHKKCAKDPFEWAHENGLLL